MFFQQVFDNILLNNFLDVYDRCSVFNILNISSNTFLFTWKRIPFLIFLQTTFTYYFRDISQSLSTSLTKTFSLEWCNSDKSASERKCPIQTQEVRANRRTRNKTKHTHRCHHLQSILILWNMSISSHEFFTSLLFSFSIIFYPNYFQ